MIMFLTIAVLLLLAAVGGGVLWADHLMPKGRVTPSSALPAETDSTELDRVVTPMLAAHPGLTGAVMLNDGLDAFAARALPTRAAGRSLDLQYYIWKDDLLGRLLALEVWRAAERGVRVRMLLDDFPAQGKDAQMLALNAHPNIELRVYNPLRQRKGLGKLLEALVRAFRINHRMHNKAWIADGQLAVVGGRNIGEAYFSAASSINFRDLDLLLVGPAVAQASAIFDRYWNSTAAVPVADLGERGDQALSDQVEKTEAESVCPQAQRYLERVDASPGMQDFLAQNWQAFWSEHIEVVADPPQKWRGDDQRRWLVHRLAQVLASATTHASLVSPYFVPGEEGTDALSGLAAQGVAVGVVTNSLAANDVPVVHSGYAKYRKPLLRSKVALYELRADEPAQTAGLFGSKGASLHTKAFVVDGQRGFIGSFNLDPRSVSLNTEMGVLFDHPGLGAAMASEFQRLAGPSLSHAVGLGESGDLRWRDDRQSPGKWLLQEPNASLWLRAVVVVLGLLPIESQL